MSSWRDRRDGRRKAHFPGCDMTLSNRASLAQTKMVEQGAARASMECASRGLRKRQRRCRGRSRYSVSATGLLPCRLRTIKQHIGVFLSLVKPISRCGGPSGRSLGVPVLHIVECSPNARSTTSLALSYSTISSCVLLKTSRFTTISTRTATFLRWTSVRLFFSAHAFDFCCRALID